MIQAKTVLSPSCLPFQGNTHMVEKIIDRGIISLEANNVVIKREDWLKVRLHPAYQRTPEVHVTS